LKNTSNKDNKYAFNQQLEHVDDISFRELFGRIRVQGLLNKDEKKLARSIFFTFRYIDHDVLSLNNTRLGEIVDLVFPIEFKIKDITDTDRTASYLYLPLEIDREGQLRTKLCDKRDDFNFPSVHFPFIASFFSSLLRRPCMRSTSYE
jgi:hypothetical protein